MLDGGGEEEGTPGSFRAPFGPKKEDGFGAREGEGETKSLSRKRGFVTLGFRYVLRSSLVWVLPLAQLGGRCLESGNALVLLQRFAERRSEERKEGNLTAQENVQRPKRHQNRISYNDRSRNKSGSGSQKKNDKRMTEEIDR